MELELSERTPCAIRMIFPGKGVVRMMGGKGHCLHVCEVVAAGKVNAELPVPFLPSLLRK